MSKKSGRKKASHRAHARVGRHRTRAKKHAMHGGLDGFSHGALRHEGRSKHRTHTRVRRRSASRGARRRTSRRSR